MPRRPPLSPPRRRRPGAVRRARRSRASASSTSTELPEATKTQVKEVVAQRGDADLQKLRSSIDATPKVKSALEAKGLTSAQVIAASMEPNGALTLMTKKAG